MLVRADASLHLILGLMRLCIHTVAVTTRHAIKAQDWGKVMVDFTLRSAYVRGGDLTDFLHADLALVPVTRP